MLISAASAGKPEQTYNESAQRRCTAACDRGRQALMAPQDSGVNPGFLLSLSAR